MKNTAQKNIEDSLDIAQEYKENPEMEALWKKTFQDEYKPDVIIDFQRIKDFIVDQKKKNEYYQIKEYNYNLIDPETLCDIFIQHYHKTFNVSFIESFPSDIKRSIADIFLSLIQLEEIQKKCWTAILFRIWMHWYPYSNKHKYLSDFLTESTSFVWSSRNYDLLRKANLAIRKHPINEVLKLFEIEKNLPQDINNDNIKTYFKKNLWQNFSLWTLYSSSIVLYGNGREEQWNKHIDNKGKIIDPDIIHNTNIYKKYMINNQERTLLVTNYKNPDIYKDFSWSSYNIYMDAPIGISLLYNDTPIAMIAFTLQDEKTLFIRQIQKTNITHFDRYWRNIGKRTDPITQTIPRQKILYDITTMIAKKYQCNKIAIQSWVNNKRIKQKQTELVVDDMTKKRIEVETNQPHLSPDIAKQIYDVFAEKQWFKKNKTTKNRDKKI